MFFLDQIKIASEGLSRQRDYPKGCEKGQGRNMERFYSVLSSAIPNEAFDDFPPGKRPIITTASLIVLQLYLYVLHHVERHLVSTATR